MEDKTPNALEDKIAELLVQAHKLPGWGVYIFETYKKFSLEYNHDIRHPIDTYKVPEHIIDDFAKNLIQSRRVKVALTGAGSGVIGGPLAYATLLADIEEYLRNVYNLSLELCYIYGVVPSPFIENIEEDETMSLALIQKDILLVLAMAFGTSTASTLVKEVFKQFAKKEAKEIMRKKISEKIIMKIAKEVAKIIGVKLTKKTVSKTVLRWVPVIGGVVSGGINYYSFREIAENLKTGLKRERENYRRLLKESGML